jgi:POT family proton-dependent oligopeptide transporter
MHQDAAVAGALGAKADTAGWAGHPRGLSTLFFTEMWERFSYYGMRAFLILYMVAPIASGGLGFSDADAASIYGTYTGSVWGAAILGGIVADRLLGQYRSVLIGAIIIALGHFTLAFKALPFFYSGLALIVIGTGLLKPNVSTLVGSLYEPGDHRRDAGFSIFYMGINSGALLGPIIAGYIAQRVNWHAGFACAGIFMVFGVAQYVLGRKRLQIAFERAAAQTKATSSSASSASDANASASTGWNFTSTEWKRLSVIVIFFLVAILFWGAYEQAGSTLNLFADRFTRTELFGFSFPSSWFQSVQPIFVILLAPAFAWLWMRLGSREPSTPGKLAIGVFAMAIAFLMLVPAGALAQSGPNVRVSPWWLIISYALSEVGEICLYPVGLSAVTKLAPVRIVGLMMGVWMLSNAFGNKLAGFAATFFSTTPLNTLFATVGIILLITAAVFALLVKPIQRLMGGVQ